MIQNGSDVDSITCCRHATRGYLGHNRSQLVFSVGEIKHILKEVAFGIKGLHGRQVLHGDVKPQNFMVRVYLQLSEEGVYWWMQEGAEAGGEERGGGSGGGVWLQNFGQGLAGCFQCTACWLLKLCI